MKISSTQLVDMFLWFVMVFGFSLLVASASGTTAGETYTDCCDRIDELEKQLTAAQGDIVWLVEHQAEQYWTMVDLQNQIDECCAKDGDTDNRTGW